MTFKVLALVVE